MSDHSGTALTDAIGTLKRTERGRAVAKGLLHLLDESGLASLDDNGWWAVTTLLDLAHSGGQFGSVLWALDQAVGPQ